MTKTSVVAEKVRSFLQKVADDAMFEGEAADLVDPKPPVYWVRATLLALGADHHREWLDEHYKLGAHRKGRSDPLPATGPDAPQGAPTGQQGAL